MINYIVLFLFALLFICISCKIVSIENTDDNIIYRPDSNITTKVPSHTINSQLSDIVKPANEHDGFYEVPDKDLIETMQNGCPSTAEELKEAFKNKYPNLSDDDRFKLMKDQIDKMDPPLSDYNDVSEISSRLGFCN